MLVAQVCHDIYQNDWLMMQHELSTGKSHGGEYPVEAQDPSNPLCIYNRRIRWTVVWCILHRNDILFVCVVDKM